MLPPIISKSCGLSMTIRTAREVGGMGPSSTGTPGAICGLFGRAQQTAKVHYPNAPPAGDRPCRPPGLVSMGRRSSAQARLCPRPGALSSLSPRCLADHRRHHLAAYPFPYPGVASWVISSWRRPLAPFTRPLGARPVRLDLGLTPSG